MALMEKVFHTRTVKNGGGTRLRILLSGISRCGLLLWTRHHIGLRWDPRLSTGSCRAARPQNIKTVRAVTLLVPILIWTPSLAVHARARTIYLTGRTTARSKGQRYAYRTDYRAIGLSSGSNVSAYDPFFSRIYSVLLLLSEVLFSFPTAGRLKKDCRKNWNFGPQNRSPG